MNEKNKNEMVDHFEAESCALEKGTVVPSANDADSDVSDVEFGDLELMGRADPDADEIERFIGTYPYREFTSICRLLKMKPAECLERVLVFNEEGNGWYSATEEAECLKFDAAKLIEEGWEPGTPPPTPMTKAEVFTLLESIFKVELNLKSAWTFYDMAYRAGLHTTEMAKWIVDFTVSRVLGTFKYLAEEKWLLSPEEIQQAAANCSWITGWPVQGERPKVPYIDYCSACGRFYAGSESACIGCGALRMYRKPDVALTTADHEPEDEQ